MPTPYSSTRLAKKLDIKTGYKMRLINPPANYFDLFTDMPNGIEIIEDKTIKKNIIHYFAKQAKNYKPIFYLLRMK